MYKIRLSCFDVFDTVLERNVDVPSDVFRLVFARLTGLFDCEAWDEDSFIAARLRAERVAALGCGHEECTLNEIWVELAISLGSIAPARGVAEELSAERSLLRPNATAKRLVEEARAVGSIIGFVSDTPLPKWFVAEQLQRFQLMTSQDLLYVSGDLRASKRTGGLYDRILKDTNLMPKEISMRGDNLYSDVTVPRRLGIRAHHHVRSADKSQRRQTQPGIAGLRTIGLNCVLKFAAPEKRLKADDWGLVPRFLGPACLSWALWALLRAREAKIRRLYFVSRDAFLAWRCASFLSSTFDIACRYLMVSRQSILLAATTSVSRASLEWLIRPWDVPTFRMICRRLEVDAHALSGRLASLIDLKGLDSPLNSVDQDQFWEALRDPATEDVLLQIFADKRLRTKNYLKQEGLFENSDWALVDLGWRGSIQAGINSLVQPGASSKGLYVYLSDERALPTVTGWAQSMFRLVPPDLPTDDITIPSVVRLATVSEHVLGIAPHGTVLGYSEEGNAWKPICQPQTGKIDPWRSKVVTRLEQFVETSAVQFLAHLNTAEKCRIFFEAITHDFLTRPVSNIVRELVDFVEVSSDHHNTVPRKIARPLGISDLIHLMMPSRFGGSAVQADWPEACIQISPAYFRKCLQLRRELPKALKAAFVR